MVCVHIVVYLPPEHQNLAMLLGMGNAAGGGVEAFGGNCSSSGVGGSGGGGVVSNNFQGTSGELPLSFFILLSFLSILVLFFVLLNH